MVPIKRSSIWWADLTADQTGQELNKCRPVLVVSNDIGNSASPVITVVPISSKPKTLPTHVEIGTTYNTSSETSTVLAECIRSIDKSRLGDFVGFITQEEMKEVNTAMSISLGLEE